MVVAITVRAALNCHCGICRAISIRLTVKAKLEKESENLMGLIQGFTPCTAPVADKAKAANTGITSIRAQPRRESSGSLASSSRRNLRTAEGEVVWTAARTNAGSQS